MASRTIKDATKALQSHFSAAKPAPSLSLEARQMLQSFVGDHEGTISEEESTRANVELKEFWEKCVGDCPAKNGAFVGVLRELRPIIVGQANLLEWWQSAVKPVITRTGHHKAAMDDTQEFLLACMCFDSDDKDAADREKTSGRLLSDLLGMYIARTGVLTEDGQSAVSENAQVAQQVESVLVAFGRKRPKALFQGLADLITIATSRLQALTLLISFLQHQTPHLYLVLETPMLDRLLKSLMNDTSTTILSVALTSLIMLLPHIPGSLGPFLPCLFLIYSRLLCWEKFSPRSTEAQKAMVTDDRVPNDPAGDHGDIGSDLSWDTARPTDGLAESAPPELLTYFTYLYGLYPLNFTSYIRKPRRYLKNLEFPAADDFDLDQAVVRRRTQQYRQAHLLHPNFFNFTVEEELIDPKWPKADPADVVADCHALYVDSSAFPKTALISPGPPPTTKLPELPPIPPLSGRNSRAEQVSPTTSHASFRLGNSWRDTQSTAVSAQAVDSDSPILRPQTAPSEDQAKPLALRLRSKTSTAWLSAGNDDASQQTGDNAAQDKDEPPQTDLAYLQSEVAVLRKDLNFERWHKAQYSQHIAQMMRKNVKDATTEAETLNLINANRALKLQLEQVRNAREATIKDSTLTRKQANSLETSMTERMSNLRREQETWRADAEELCRLRTEMKQYRELLVAAESRETNTSHQLEIIKRDLEQMQKLQGQLQDAQRKLREYEYREFEFDRAKHEQEILQSEKATLQMKIQRYRQDQDRVRRVYGDRVAELGLQLDVSESQQHRPVSVPPPDAQALAQHAVEAKLVQLKRAYARLLEKHTDLELEHQSVQSHLETLQRPRSVRALSSDADLPQHDGYTYGALHSMHREIDIYDALRDYSPTTDSPFPTTSTSDPTSRRYQPPPTLRGMPASPPASDDILHSSAAGLTFNSKPLLSRHGSLASRSSGIPPTFNQTAPLRQDEMGEGGGGVSSRKDKPLPESPARLFGRGE